MDRQYIFNYGEATINKTYILVKHIETSESVKHKKCLLNTAKGHN